jgi:hypothetical protein
VPWVLVDVGIALLAVGLLIGAAVGLWRGVRAFFRTARAASEKVSVATDALAAAQADRPGH